jgi:hypothetical protein
MAEPGSTRMGCDVIWCGINPHSYDHHDIHELLKSLAENNVLQLIDVCKKGILWCGINPHSYDHRNIHELLKSLAENNMLQLIDVCKKGIL